MSKVIIMNGPPGSGKDTIAHCLHGNEVKGSSVILSFKEPILKQASALSGIPVSDIIYRHNDRELKEESWNKFGGLSTREFLIKISEEYVKPLFGKDYYGDVAGKKAREALKCSDRVIFSDSGFQEEIDRVIDYVGRKNVLLVRLSRPGTTFEGDSRGYLSADGCYVMDLNNEGTVRWAAKEIVKKIEEIEDMYG